MRKSTTVMCAKTSACIEKFKQLFWPVHLHELSRFLPLFFIKLFVSFNYAILHSTKDTVVVKGAGGAEVIPVLKGGLVLLVAFLVMLLYSRLSNSLSRTKLFYVFTVPFLLFFFFYGTYLFPNKESLSPTASADLIQSFLGDQHKHWVVLYRYWMDSAFFVLSELWGGLMIGVLFWGFANQITNVKDAVRFYTLYSAGGHLGTIAAGGIVFGYANHMREQDYNETVFAFMIIVSVICVAIMSLYWWVNKYVVNKADFQVNLPESDRDLNSKTKLSLIQSILYIAKSPYLGFIALMVIGYGLSVNLVEVSWKAILNIYFKDSNEFQAFMGALQFILGVLSFFIAMFVGGALIRKLGWYFGAKSTPIVLGVTSLLFFAAYFMLPDLAAPTIVVLVAIGTIHNISCKAMKYCLFDPTKEMAYIPLDYESKIKGKAAVDLVGARFGKSGASWLQLALIDLLGSGSILAVVPILFPFVAAVVAIWMLSVRELNKRFVKLTKKTNDSQGIDNSELASI